MCSETSKGINKSTDPTQKATDPSVREVHTVNSHGGVTSNPQFHSKPLPPKDFNDTKAIVVINAGPSEYVLNLRAVGICIWSQTHEDMGG